MKKLTGSLMFLMMSLSACGPQDAGETPPEGAPAVESEEEIAAVAAALSCGYGTTRSVQASPSTLASKLTGASCGDELVLASGTYGGSYTFAKACEGQKPVVLRAQGALGAVLTGTLTLKGSHVIVTGLKVQGGELVFQGKGARVTRNFITSPKSMTFEDGAVRNRVDHNEFRDTYRLAGTQIGTGVPGGDLIFNLRGDDKVLVSHNRVDHNLFRGTRSIAPTGGVSVYVGTYDLASRTGFVYNTDTLVEHNYWANWKKLSSIEIKSSRTTFRHNVIDTQSAAKVLNRNGVNSVFAGNSIGGTGLRIYDEDHTLLGNRVTRDISLYADGRTGTEEEAEDGVGLRKGAHGARVIGNQGRLVLGDNEGAKDLEPVRNVLVEAHQGDVVKVPGLTSGLVVRASTPQSVPPVASFTPSAVGINAGSACQ